MAHRVDSNPSAKVPDLTGCVIRTSTARLRLVECVTRGGSGVIYRAENTTDSSEYYAVKCIALSQMDNPRRASVANEVRLQKACARASPFVLKIIDYVENLDFGTAFIITEFCDGGDLWDQIIKEEIGEIDRDDESIRNTFIQILDAVSACHSVGVYHRDLKPENILVKDGGTKVVLGDFGFATRKEKTRDFGKGTMPFMSPEVRNRSYDPSEAISHISSSHADIWALGVILVNLITGEYPWDLASFRDPDFYTYFETNPDHLYHYHPISREADEILKSIFKFDPYQRTCIKDLRQRILRTKTFLRSSDHDLAVNLVLDEPNGSSQSDDAQLDAVNGPIIIDVHITEDIIDAFPAPPGNLQTPAFDAADNNSFTHADPPASDSSEGPITPETHAVDDVAVSGVDSRSALLNVPELGLCDASAFTGIDICATCAKTSAEDNWARKDVVPFAPPGLYAPADVVGGPKFLFW